MFMIELWLEFSGHAGKKGVIEEFAIFAGELFNGYESNVVRHHAQFFLAFTMYRIQQAFTSIAFASWQSPALRIPNVPTH